ncbi:hypothetical protein KM043_013772 [Ampulex compressa]|nr:hypothetical protein KM043_013772 [Ampulex compressa]
MRQVPTPQAFHQDAIESAWTRGGVGGGGGGSEDRGGGRREILKDAAPPTRSGERKGEASRGVVGPKARRDQGRPARRLRGPGPGPAAITGWSSSVLKTVTFRPVKTEEANPSIRSQPSPPMSYRCTLLAVPRIEGKPALADNSRG